MFTFETTVRLYDTDGAGLLFFGHQFRIAHAAYEAYMESHGVGFGDIIRQGKYLLPIVHASADYDEPLFVGDRVTIELTAEKISTHSYTLDFRLVGESGNQVGSVRTVHVCVDRATRKKIPLPKPLRQVLEGLC